MSKLEIVTIVDFKSNLISFSFIICTWGLEEFPKFFFFFFFFIVKIQWDILLMQDWITIKSCFYVWFHFSHKNICLVVLYHNYKQAEIKEKSLIIYRTDSKNTSNRGAEKAMWDSFSSINKSTLHLVPLNSVRHWNEKLCKAPCFFSGLKWAPPPKLSNVLFWSNHDSNAFNFYLNEWENPGLIWLMIMKRFAIITYWSIIRWKHATENLTRVKRAISCIREDCEACDKSLQNLHKYVWYSVLHRSDPLVAN